MKPWELATAFDGQPRDEQTWKQLATPEGRIQYALQCTSSEVPRDMHRLCRQRYTLSPNERARLALEIRQIVAKYHIMALLYVKGPLSEEEKLQALQDDRKATLESLGFLDPDEYENDE